MVTLMSEPEHPLGAEDVEDLQALEAHHHAEGQRDRDHRQQALR